jgi:hypothetical protein
MLRKLMMMSALMSAAGEGSGGGGGGGGGAGGTPPANQPPATPPNTPPPAGTPPAPEPITFPNAEAFNQRVAQAARAQLRELGVDPDKAKDQLAELERLKAEAAERKKAELSASERAAQEAQEAKARAETAEAAAAAAREELEITRLAAEHGIRDVGYVTYRLGLAKPEDRKAWLAEELKKPTERVRFGLEGTPAAPAAPPANSTTTTPNAVTPPADQSQNGRPAPKDTMSMTPAEYAEYKRQRYGTT